MRKANIGPESFLKFDNTYSRLPQEFFCSVRPTPVCGPSLIKFNRELARELQLDFHAVSDVDLAQVFSGNLIPLGAEPLAQVYAGHQFGHFVPQLGDGRAILLGEIIDVAGHRYDFQLKGAGKTPFSRRGDGRAALGPVIREYIVSEAMHKLGIPTTRSLVMVTTGEVVWREGPLPGAILTRVAASHIRIGTFEYFASRSNLSALRQLADYAIDRHFPHLKTQKDCYVEFLKAVISRQASLIASWMNIGFIHGVMNTDNMTISGETIDYGPCAFLDTYDSEAVFSAIDRQGRYAFGRQPAMAQWNLGCFAQALMPLLSNDSTQALELAKTAFHSFPEQYEAHWLSGMRKKLGLLSEHSEDLQLARDFLTLLEERKADFTNSFCELAVLISSDGVVSNSIRVLSDPGFTSWLSRWRTRLVIDQNLGLGNVANVLETMNRVNPIYIPRNHRIEQVIRAGVDRQDFSPFEELLRVLQEPLKYKERTHNYAWPPEPHERITATFCGT
jgi:uncharacterized protein YdiU (UPF0061 family)